MKKHLRLLPFVFLLCCLSCRKGGSTNTTTISNLDAANMVAYSLAINANGFANNKADIALNAQNMVSSGAACGTVNSSSLARQEPTSSAINYNFALGYQYTLNCVNNVQDNIDSDISISGSFDGTNLSAVNEGNVNINVSGLAPTTLAYTFNGSVTSTGTFKVNTGDMFAGNENMTINLSNVTVKKSSRSFTGGGGTVNVSGNVTNRGDFNYNGSIIFDGKGNAILSLEGHDYTINLTTADLTEQ